ncbi:MAG: leucyl aminopeptidase family protein [Phycisphaerales bacterium]|nr:leucyl aminopeptidase family protein [Phycisphaerales bacterium]
MFDSVSLAASRGSARSAADVLVLGVFKGASLDDKSKPLAGDAGAGAIKRGEATGELGAIAEAFPSGRGAPSRIIIVGLGEKSSLSAGSFRAIAAGVGRRLAVTKDASVRVEFAGPIAAAKLDAGACGSAFGEGLGLLAWTCDHFRGSATPKKDRTRLKVSTTHAPFADGLARGLALAESANVTRTLSQTPPNIATPAWMASEARKMARKVGLSCEVMQGDRLEKERFTGLINVGKASENAPCMIRLEYAPRGAAREKPVVLVGKTMTYDSGGLSLKINNGMKGMKRDKDGGCAVFGAMHAIATVIKPKHRVVALLACAENSISDEAYRPDDVITFRNGVSVEVTNTDAEGRLVLADALCWACEKENPSAVIDLATLTGGVVVALGSVYAGMWCDDDRLRQRVERAAESSGELVWRLPHHQKYRDMMKSPIADIVNSAPVREAHPIQGAAFLSYFVENGIPWCHLDIAGTHATERDAGPFIAGPTGFGARLLAELLDQ